MITKLLATTALAGVIATGAFAQSATTPTNQTTTPMAVDTMAPAGVVAGGYMTTLGADQYLASELTGQEVYESSAPDAKKAGEIKNFLIGKDGKVAAAIVDTGSFLDKSKTVAVPFDKIGWTMADGDEPRAVLTASRSELEAAPAFTETSAQEAANSDAMAPGVTTSAAPATSGQMAAANDTAYPATVGGDQVLSQTLISQTVYSGPGEDAGKIGDVNDLVIGKSGSVDGAIIGVGGFLGIGEKDVGAPFAALTMDKDADNKTRIVMAATKEQLTAAPSFDADGDETASNDTAAPATTAGAATSGDMTTASTTTGQNDQSKMTPVRGPELTAENVVGATVYGPNDNSIGKVGDIAMTADGKVDAVIVDVGGFLGIGSKPVAVAMDNLKFMRDSGGSMYLYTAFTQDQLKNAPEYQKDSYAENRATMRVTPGMVLAPATPAATTNP